MKPILVINDDRELMKTMTKQLDKFGYEYVTAATRNRTMTLAKDLDFSLVLLDLKLDEIDGVDLYDALIKREAHYTLPVIALIDTLDKEEIEVVNRLLPKGPVTLITKPLDEALLIDLVCRYVDVKV